MKQILQSYSTGKIELADVPVPACSANNALVSNVASLISIGTERSIIELGKKSLLGKARARPDLVKRFIEKAQNEGLVKTFKEALGRLDNPTALGYSCAGTVIKVGSNVHEYAVGDRVACIGAGYASHAEVVSMPSMLCSRIPENVSFAEASFGMLGIISLHGIRCANLSFGASAVVIGLGLLGLLSVQLLRAYGCRVFGLDVDESKLALALKYGAEFATSDKNELKSRVERATNGHGVDAVVITAATKSSEPVNLAIDLSMYRGKIVLVGVADVHPERNELWHKEVQIIVSKSGGPGIFDVFYENKGIDYPYGLVRWTENRNLEEFLRLLSEKRVDVNSLITHRFSIDDALQAYDGFAIGKLKGCIGIVLDYPESKDNADHLIDRIKILKSNTWPASGTPRAINLGVIGAGLFGKALLLPQLSKIKDVNLKTLSTSSSANSFHTARKYGFEAGTTDYRLVLDDPQIDAVVILTPHSLHAKMVIEAIEADKHVFVEKPLCTNVEQLGSIIKKFKPISEAAIEMPHLMVGYNRRFSPHSQRMKEFFSQRSDPMVISYRVNSGFVPINHWVHAEEEGGGRIIGEMCHFVDMMQYLSGSDPDRVFVERTSGNDRTCVNNDNLVTNIKFQDGSVGSIIYSASGDRLFSRERIEIFCEGKSVVCTDFKETVFYSNGKKKRFKGWNQELGFKEELESFIKSIRGEIRPLLTPEEIFMSTATVLAISQSLTNAIPVEVKNFLN